MQALLERLARKEEENEKVFHKEIFVLRNDLYYKFFEHRQDRWFVDIAYKPRQIPSGDAYSIRRLDENRVLILLFDAMGKGLSASITSILSSAFVNNYIDTALEEGRFCLSSCARACHRFLKPLIFEEEALSCALLLFDFADRRVEYVMFGMPPVLMCDKNGQIRKLRSSHTPMTKATSDFTPQSASIQDVVKMLIYTDGLNETILQDHKMYHAYLSDDFKNAPNYKHFLQTVMQRTETFDDDMTFVFLEKELCNQCRVERYSIQSTQKAVDEMIEKVDAFLVRHGMPDKERAYMLQAFTEMIVNAYEHGNLGIDHATKAKLMEEGRYEAYVRQQEAQFYEKKIDILLHLKEEEHLKTFKIDIQDEGKGFDTALMRNRIIKKSQFNGRGLLMVSKSVDAYYYNDKANRVIIKKFIPKEHKDDNS